jgi:hypothetical protein
MQRFYCIWHFYSIHNTLYYEGMSRAINKTVFNDSEMYVGFLNYDELKQFITRITNKLKI